MVPVAWGAKTRTAFVRQAHVRRRVIRYLLPGVRVKSYTGVTIPDGLI